jgi:4-amino-4-deoxy-L-arabinose transferase-like glycosyltransferase
LFPGLLTISHRLLAADDAFLILGRAGEKNEPLGRRFTRQFYAGVVPVVSSLLLVLGTFALGRRLFSEEVGLIAAFLLTITPIQILTGQRVWADATLAALVTWAVWLSVRGSKLAGLCFALALLTKITAVLTIPAFLCVAWSYRQPWKSQVAFWAIVALVTLPWYGLVYRTFGTPFFAPAQPGISQTQEWFALINRQPWWTYLVGVPLQVPVFVLGYAGVAWATRGKGEMVLAVWFLVWLIGLTVLTSVDEMLGPEHRYLLPALPALVLLTAQGISTARTVLRERFSALVANGMVAAVLIMSTGWALLIAWQSRGFDEIVLPF